MREPITIGFGPLAPDQAGYSNPGIVKAVNVIPQTGSYGPFRDMTTISNALTGRAYGAISAKDSANDTFVYAGDASKLYEMVNSVFTDESKSGGYTVLDDDIWEFVLWNKGGTVLATSYTDAVQSLTVGGGSSGAFADLITSTYKPKAKHIAVINRFVMLGNTDDGTDGKKISRIWWSGIDDATDFDPDAATQCDYEDLPTGGAVQRIVGGTEYGLVFQDDAVRTIRYVGAGTVFDIQPINYAPGTPIPNSVVAHKGRVFYIAEDGFFAINAGQVEPIGSALIDRYFWDQFDVGNKRAVSSAVDPILKLVCWAFPGAGASSSLPNRILMFKYDTGQWAEAEIATEWLVKTSTQGYTLDTLDTVGTDIDSASVFDVSLDSDKWKGGALRFAAFDQTHKLNFFTGPTKKGTIITGDVQVAAGRRWQTHYARPLVDSGNVAVSIAPRTRLKDTVTYLTASSMNTDGACPQRADGRYMRFQSSITSSTSWSHFQGLQLDYELKGVR